MSIKYFLFSLILGFSLFSCVGNRKMGKVSGKLSDLQAKQAVEGNKVNGISAAGESKLSERKIDSNINVKLNQRISSIKQDLDSVNTEIEKLKSLTTDLKTFKKSYRKEIKPKLEQLDAFAKQYNDRLKIYLMMEDGLNIANYTLFDLAAFFGPGLYSIPPEQRETAGLSFMPLIDSLLNFSSKYQDIASTGSLVILGFADGQNINPDGSLYLTLSNMLNKTDAVKEELNKKLSELRALELISQMTRLFIQKTSSSPAKLKVEYIGQGKGEEYPIPSIKDYRENDERRRIVLCYWSVLPDIK